MLSVIIITRDEEQNLPRLFESLPKTNVEVIVVDSGSQDNTRKLAEDFGAKVFTREFDDYSSQKNFAISKSSFSWILWVDADEKLSHSLCETILRICRSTSPQSPTAYKVTRQLVFQGRTLKYGKTTDHPLRLFKKEEGRFVGAIHEIVDLNSQVQVKTLKQIMLHYSYASLDDYFKRFNRYTRLIADNHYTKQKRSPRPIIRKFRPWLEFVSRYFLRLGFLDGHEGYVYAICSSLYALIKYEKLAEKEKEFAKKSG